MRAAEAGQDLIVGAGKNLLVEGTLLIALRLQSGSHVLELVSRGTIAPQPRSIELYFVQDRVLPPQM